MSSRDTIVYVRHMLDHAREAVEMTYGCTRADLDENRVLNQAGEYTDDSVDTLMFGNSNSRCG